mmetsp:Transcript_43396/g.102204  ORF Transcript_43396/g.102204 Transcript_43396/m.102204 type:complete len:696 (-) Transcript_43396:69-2156(-)|eukprot:CAMPEP_0178409660 /NCGR_PEP_ID=MMETSP0689_2-20121128/20575_1 /TAXON_ID=160604 /ORGANISM="Amphidinium massartii, Strain CS-259" /LENGTH=695 /DNA_ID=CAMNT_0020030805 /DNA_START=81 /DNA_END=2168 /DNA_ORIENTATION=-
MKISAAVALLAVVSLATANAAVVDLKTLQAEGVTPIQKVLVLLNKMLTDGIAEKKEEEVKFAKFEQWCGDQTRTKEEEIKAGAASIEALTATIEKTAANIRGLGARIAEVEEDVGRWTKDSSAASSVRQREKVDFTATLQDYTESVDAITQAIVVLKKQTFDRAQAALVQQSLLQVRDLRRVPMKAKAALMAFLQQGQPERNAESIPDERLFNEAPEANAYEFQSQGVIDMLEKLKDEFETKRSELQKEEMTAQHAFEQIMQQLTDNMENGNHEVDRKKVLKAEAGQAKAEAEGSLAQTTKDKTEDESYLSDLTALCTQKKTDFDSRQSLRAEEIESLQKAIEIISSHTVQGSGEEYLPQLIQRSASGKKHTVLTQLRREQENPLQSRIAAFLESRAERSGSKLLSQVAEQVAADPFGKVKKLIKDLISKLMQEATAETEHKGWCDSELATNKVNREARTAEAAKLTESIDELNADILKLTQESETLAREVSEIQANMAQMTADRQASKEANMKTIKEAKEAQAAVEEAIAVLKDYYAKSTQATAMVQQTPIEDAPETFEKPYKGMFPEGGNIVDFLEVILTDFTRLESSTSADEAQEQDEYEKFMFESKKDVALKENAKEHALSTKTDKEEALHNAEEELKMTQEQLEKAQAYYDKLKPTCVDSGITYEERVRRREEEIQSLEEALKILAGEDI